jgi:DNA-binding response OmpR family regulator
MLKIQASPIAMNFQKRILLIDDEPHLTALVRPVLVATGRYLIREENHRRGALHAALHFQPDLVLLDSVRPNLDHGVAQAIHRDPALRDVPVVLLTGLAPDRRISSVGFFGGYTFFANPFSIEEVVACIAEMLSDQTDAGAAA